MYGCTSLSSGTNGNPLLEGDERHYFKRMKEILESFPNKGPPSVISQLLPHLYIGSLRNAEDLNMLQRVGITHVLNVAGTRKFDLTKSPYPKEVGVKEFMMIPAEDHDEYNISQHFFESNAFINRAKRIGGKALVHCNLGVNRCAALCCAYLLTEERLPILEVVTYLKKKRVVVLCNKGFRRQILRYAMARGLVEPVGGTSTPNYYASLGTISKYLVNRPRPDITAPQKQQSKTQEKIEPMVNGHTSNGHASNGHDLNTKNEDNKENSNGNKETNGNKQSNGKSNGNAVESVTNGNGEPMTNGHSTEEDEEVALIVDQPPKKSRFLPRNSLLYNQEPEENGSSRPARSHTRSNTDDLAESSRPYSPTHGYSTDFSTPSVKPYQRSYSADIEYQDRCFSPSYDNVRYDDHDNDLNYVRVRTRGRTAQRPKRPTTVCSDYGRYNTTPQYHSRRPSIQIDDDDLDSEYTPMINTFHLENLDGDFNSKYGSKSGTSGMYMAMSFSSDHINEPDDLDGKVKINGYVHVKPYVPSLEFVGRKYVAGSSTSTLSAGRYLPRNSRPHSVYTDRPSYTSSENLYTRRSVTPTDRSYTDRSTFPGDRSQTPTGRSYAYKGYTPDILPSDSLSHTRSYSTLPRSFSSSYRHAPRGPISSAILRQTRNLTNSISDYTRSYDYLR